MNKFNSSIWNTEKLGRLVERIRKPVQVSPEKKYREIGIRSHGKGIFHKAEVLGRELGDKRVFWVEPGCFVLNIVFAWEQAVALTTEAEKGFIASHRFPMFRSLPGKIDLRYLLYFFNTKRGKHLLELASPGGAGRNKTLGQQAFLDLPIPVPPIGVQQKIARILGTWDEAIATTEQLIAALEHRKKGLMQRLLTGQMRFSEFGEPAKVENSLPADWCWVRLDEVFKRVRRPVNSDTFRVLSITATVGFVDQREKFGRVIAGKNLKRYVLLKRGEFSYNKGHSIFYPQGCIYPLREYDEGAVPNVYYSFRINSPRVDGRFYKHYFEHSLFNEQLQRRINTGVRNDGLLNLSADDFFSVKIAVPPLEEQKEIANVLDIADHEIEKATCYLAALKQQKKGLMQRLLTGRARVRPDDEDTEAA